MKQPSNILTPLLLALALVTIAPAVAEEKEPEYRCSAELGVCLDWMAAHYANRGWAGLQLDRSDGHFTVTEVHDGSPAQKAKVRSGDILVALNGINFVEENNEKLVALQDKMTPGAQFTYTVKRDGKRRNIDVVLVEMPFEIVAQQVGMHLLTDHVDIRLALPAED